MQSRMIMHLRMLDLGLGSVTGMVNALGTQDHLTAMSNLHFLFALYPMRCMLTLRYRCGIWPTGTININTSHIVAFNLIMFRQYSSSFNYRLIDKVLHAEYFWRKMYGGCYIFRIVVRSLHLRNVSRENFIP